MYGCFAEPEWRHGGQPSFSPPLTAVSIPFHGLSFCKRCPFGVQKAVNRNAKGRLQRCKRRSFASLSTVFSLLFSCISCTHSCRNAVKSVINGSYVCTRTTGVFPSGGAFFAEQRPSHAPTEIKKKEFFNQKLLGVNGSYRSLCSLRELKDIALQDICPLTPGDRKGA